MQGSAGRNLIERMVVLFARIASFGVAWSMVLGPVEQSPNRQALAEDRPAARSRDGHRNWGPVRSTDSSIDDRVQQLIARGLLETAEAWIVAESRDEPAGEDEAAAWNLRLSDVRTARALRMAEAPEEAWEAARSPVASSLAAYPNQSRAAWLRTQLAMIELARGRALILEYLAAPQRLNAQQDGLAAMRSAIDRLRDETKSVDQLLIDTRRAEQTSIRLQELEALALQLEMSLIEGLLARAEAYPAGSADAFAAAGEALERNGELMSRVAPGSPQAVTALQLRARCHLALESPQEALQSLAPFRGRDANGDLSDDGRSLALLIRISLALDDLPAARRLVDASRDTIGTDPDLALAELAVLAAESAERAGDAMALAAVTAQLDRISEQHGPYWRRRAETVVLGSLGSASAGNPTLLAAQAAAKLRDGKAEEASALWQRAAAAAQQAQDCSAALQLSLQATAAAKVAGRATPAALQLAEIAIACRSEPRAAAAHAQAALLVSQTPSFANDRELQQRYVDLLQQQLEVWPADQASHAARQWLAKWWLLQGDPLASATAWLSTPPHSPQAAEAISQAGRLTREALRSASTEAQSAIVAEAQERWSRYAAEAPAELRAAIEREQRTSRVLWGQPRDDDSTVATTASSDDAIAIIDFIAAIRTGRPPQPLDSSAIERFRELDEPWLEDAQRCLLADGSAAAERGRIAEGLLVLSGGSEVMADPPTLTLAARAAALCWLARYDAARQTIDQLFERGSDATADLEWLAQLLSDANTGDAWSLALEIQRKLAAGLPAGSDRWLNARFASVQLLARLGQKEEALKLARYVMATQAENLKVPSAWQTLVESLQPADR